MRILIIPSTLWAKECTLYMAKYGYIGHPGVVEETEMQQLNRNCVEETYRLVCPLHFVAR